MGKLVIKFQGRLVGEINLKLGDTKIGRKSTCEVSFNDPLVSSEHAVVKTVGLKSTIQDLDSKNGTFIENQRVTQHELRHGETILIGGHTLVYRDDMNLDAPVFGARAASKAPVSMQKITTEIASFAQLIAVEGTDKGKHFPLVKESIALENPGKNPAQISRTVDGYLLVGAAGPGEPMLNGRPIPPGGHVLENGDIIDVAGTKFQFSDR
jgi:predicted component of type VI protein secretion system